MLFLRRSPNDSYDQGFPFVSPDTRIARDGTVGKKTADIFDGRFRSEAVGTFFVFRFWEVRKNRIRGETRRMFPDAGRGGRHSGDGRFPVRFRFGQSVGFSFPFRKGWFFIEGIAGQSQVFTRITR